MKPHSKLVSFVLPLAGILTCLVPSAVHADWPFGAAGAGSDAAAEATPVRVFRVAGAARETPATFDFMGGGALVFPELLETIRAEAKRPEVKTMLFKLGDVQLGFAQAAELASTLAEARRAGKRVLVHLESAGLRELAIAAQADEIHLAPEGSVTITGFQAEVTFYRDLLGTLGLEADIESVGQYKSAMEPFTRTSLSDPAKENLEALIDSLYGAVLDAIGRPRKIARADLEALVDRGLLTADEAKKARLVDELSYWSDVLAGASKIGAASLAWPKPSEAPSLTSFFDVLKLFGGDDAPASPSKPRVAVLVADGEIIEGRGGGDPFDDRSVVATEDFLDALHAVETDESVKAIVLRVDSPGGSALASDLMWRELARVGKTRPLVVSMGDVAASGGYYIAAAGQKIFAEPTTLTGSIGVFGGKFVYKGLLDKVGVTTTIISRGKNAGLFSGLARFSDSEREVLKASMRHTYETFVNKVARGRNMSFDAIDKIAQGRVYSGSQALEVGLVDKLGGLGDAVAEAARLGKVGPDFETVRYPKSKSLLELLEKTTDSKRLTAPRLDLAEALPEPLAAKVRGLARVVEGLLGREQVLALMPFALTLR